jgi:hypothetical protein
MITWKQVKLAAAPYMVWIKVAALAAVVAVSFASGCTYSESQQATANAATAAELATLRTANAKYEQLEFEREQQLRANQRLAAEQLELADKARVEAMALRRQLDAKEREWEQRYRETMTEDRCAEIMEMQVCEVSTDGRRAGR